jgi:aminoglycoside phosphotransferase (APT) family kinase protein
MDMRPANVLTRDGHIVAVIDWSNALIGDPALELARIAEYGYLDAEFYAGYGMTDGFAHVPRSVELLYRLDTAVMLAVVFLSESPDPQCAQSQGQRVIKLSAQLSALLK